MNVAVRSVQIADRLLGSMLLRFIDKPGMPRRIELCPSNGKAQLKWHIETRCARRFTVKLDTGEIVDGIAACLYEFENPIQPVDSTRDAEGGFRGKSKLDQAGDIGKIERTELPVVWNVQKNGVRFNARLWHVSRICSSRLSSSQRSVSTLTGAARCWRAFSGAFLQLRAVPLSPRRKESASLFERSGPCIHYSGCPIWSLP